MRGLRLEEYFNLLEKRHARWRVFFVLIGPSHLVL